MRRASILILVALPAFVAACSAGAQPGNSSPAGGASGGSATTTTAVPSAGTAGPSAAAGTGAFEGTLTTSGQYAATWRVATDAEPNPFNGVNNPSLTSDKGTFGNIAVQPDGSVAFGSAASELTNGSYKGTGAKVTLDTSGQFVCAFTLDSDLTGSTDGAILHMSGGMKVRWTLGVGDTNCP
jgi:hypothetical protein